MKKLLLGILFVFAFSAHAQILDSLLIADFDDEDLKGWTSWSDASETIIIGADPENENNFVMETIVDCLREGENKAGYALNVNIIAEDDTASSIVVYAWFEKAMLDELQGLQFFCMDMTNWAWQAHWYTTMNVKGDTWNRLEYDFQQSFDNTTDFASVLGNGLQCGVEFVFNEGSEYFGSILGDDSYLMFEKEGTSQVEDHDITPTSFTLENNYPNPFNPTTTISYTLPQRSIVSINIYDANGRFVETLVNSEPQPAGRIAVPFDASNLASGIYYYQVAADNAVQTGKMLLVK